MKKLIYSALVMAMTAFTLASCEDVPAPYALPSDNGGTDTPDTPSADATGDGTLENPFNVAGAIKYIADGGSEDTEQYVKGIVVSVVAGSYDASYGSLKYYISDDGASTNQFYVYNGYAGPNRTKFKSEEDLKAGDEVVVCGKLITYNNTKEFQTGNYLVSLNGKSTTGGTDTPVTPTEGTYVNETFASSFGSFTEKTIKGTAWTIDSYGYAKATGYANGTTTPSESYLVSAPIDLTNSKGAVVSFEYVLRYYTNYGASKPGVEDKVLVTDNYTGDPATTSWTDITGTLTEGSDWKTWYTYSGNIPSAFIGKKNIVVALYYACADNSATWEVKNLTVKEGQAGTTGGDDKPAETSEGITIDGTTVTLTNSAVTAGTESITYDVSTLGQDKASEMTTITLSDGTTITFDGNGETNTPKYYTTEIRVYKNNAITITGHKAIAKVIFTCSGTDRVGNTTATLQTSGNSLVYTNTYTEASGGGVQLRIKNIQIVYAK